MEKNFENLTDQILAKALMDQVRVFDPFFEGARGRLQGKGGMVWKNYGIVSE